RCRPHAGTAVGPGQGRLAAARQDRQPGAGRRTAPPHRRPGARSRPGARRPGRLADRGNRRAVLPADRQIEGHRHARRHSADRAGHAAGARLHRGTGLVMAGLVMTGDIYSGRHRRDGALGSPGAVGAVKPDGPAWSRAGRLLAAQIVVIAKEPVPGRVKTRLTRPFTPREAAALAEAALTDTLAAVA